MIVTGSCMVITGALFLLYDLCVLGGIRRSHRRQISSTVTHEARGIGKNVEKNVEGGFIDAILGN
jgi:hypothetical protein